MGSPEDEFFFFQQTKFRTIPRRSRKMPEDLPESLKFAHLNPKVAAYLASKEKQKQEEDLFGDGLGKKSLMPEISQAFMSIKNRLDSSLSNDEDSQRYLFEEARANAGTVLIQLAKIIYYYDDIASHIPKSLEYQLMCGVRELTADVNIVPREWQTLAMKEAHARMLASAADAASDDDETIFGEDGRLTRAQSVTSTVADLTGPLRVGGSKKRMMGKGGQGLPEIGEDGEGDWLGDLGKPRRQSSRMSFTSRAGGRRSMQMDKLSVAGSVAGRSRRGLHDYELMSALTETPSENRSTAMGNPSYFMSVIQFQLSSKMCEEKGWIVQKGRENDLAQEAIFEYCIQILQQARKLITEQKAQEKTMSFDHPVQVRYYGDSRKETLLKYRRSPTKAAVNPVAKGGKPKIPSIYNDRDEGKQLMLAGHLDGTTVAYYPSGRPAVVASTAGFGRTGFYTVAYDDDLDMKMLACFTPSGRGVCYHSSGNIRFLAASKGGHLADKNGSMERKWKWSPGGVKITTTIGFQLNSHLVFRCISETNMSIVFSCAKESVRFSVGGNLSEPVARSGEEPEQLLSDCTFSSRAAKELLRLFAPKTKSHKSKGKRKEKINKQLAELVKSVDNHDRNLYDIEADKELARLQRKTRNLIDDWMEHYRLAIGLKSPSLTTMPESPGIRRRRQTQSAKPWDGEKLERRVTLGVEQKEVIDNTLRAPSAPTVVRRQRGGSARSGVQSPTRSTTSLAVKFDQMADSAQAVSGEAEAGNEELKDLAMSVISRFSENSHLRSKSASFLPKPASRQGTSTSLLDRDPASSLMLCPAALRMILLEESRPQCRCSRHAIPNISDVEYDAYIDKEAPRAQLQIITIYSSLFTNANPAESMLNHIYASINRNRTWPCLMSRSDPFRIFKYDINTAAEGSNHTQPLLLTRHNVVPGMILIYGDSKLLFCDHILNGYGYTQRDFKKQISKSRLDFLQRKSLPSDFRFSPGKGPHGLRAAWGGEIGGTGVDRFGSPGTSLDRSLTEVPSADKSLTLVATSTVQPGSTIPSLPPLPLTTMQRSASTFSYLKHKPGRKGFKHESVRIKLPSTANPVATVGGPNVASLIQQPPATSGVSAAERIAT